MATSSGHLELVVDTHRLTGVKRAGRWTFTCNDYPDLAREFSGAEDTGAVTAAFMRRALTGGITAKRLSRGGG